MELKGLVERLLGRRVNSSRIHYMELKGTHNNGLLDLGYQRIHYMELKVAGGDGSHSSASPCESITWS